MSFFEPCKSGYLIRIKLTPNASACGFKGVFCNADGAEYIKAYVNSVPEKGKANLELIKMLAKILKIAKQNITIITGMTEHLKKIYIQSEQNQDMTERLINLQKLQKDK